MYLQYGTYINAAGKPPNFEQKNTINFLDSKFFIRFDFHL